MVVHSSEHLGFKIPKIVSSFPGVPAFFFVSGLLVYASYVNSPGLAYVQNRSLRILPALVVVTIGGVVIALIAHGWRDIVDNFVIYASWFLAQVTLGQSYNPSHFRDIGVGVMNGSLWTISTEILFYVSVPILVFLERHFRHVLVALMMISFLFYAFGPEYFDQVIYGKRTVYDVISISPIPWGWMFGFGILVYKHYGRLEPYIRFFPIAAVPLVAMILWGSGSLFGNSGNRVGLIYFVCYVSLICFASFRIKAMKLKYDMSYGVYIWHMPIINLLLVLSIRNPALGFLLAVSLTILMSTISWFCIERPMLKLKRRSLNSAAPALSS